MSGVLCDYCVGYFQTSDHLCGEKLSRSLRERVRLHEKTQKELTLTQQGISSAVQDIKRLEAEVQKLHEEIMRRDTRPDFERGEYAGQDAMLRHLEKMDETNNSAMATAVKKSPYVQGLFRLLAQHADSLHCASYSLGQEFDPEAAKAFHSEFCIVQKRCELWSKDLVNEDG